MTDTQNNKKQGAKNVVALLLVGLVAGMVGLSFAAVPLYRIFCQATGYNGTPQRASRGADKVLDRTITVRFDANVSPELPWRFKPLQREVTLKLGEERLPRFRFTRAKPHSASFGCGTAELTWRK